MLRKQFRFLCVVTILALGSGCHQNKARTDVRLVGLKPLIEEATLLADWSRLPAVLIM